MDPSKKVAPDEAPIQKGGEDDCSDGPVTKRKVTDVCCLVAIIVHWFLFLVVAITGFMDGDPERLVTHRDHRGAYCGLNDNWNPWNSANAAGDATYDMEGYGNMGYMMNVDKFLESAARGIVCGSAGKTYWETTQSKTDFSARCGSESSADLAGTEAMLAKYTDPSEAAGMLTGGDGGNPLSTKLPH